VTLWFGIVDDLFDGVHNGLDIQDEIGAPVYSISDGVVTDIYSDPFYGNVVSIDFLYYEEHKQAKYNHMGTIDVAIGETVSKGQTIGTMSTHETVDKGLLELRLYKEDVPIDPFVFMERPDYDVSYLSFPMAFSKDTSPMALQVASFDLGRSILHDNSGNSLSELEMHRRFMGNLDIEEGEEVYLRKWAYDFVINRSGYRTPEEFEEAGYLTWCEVTRTATFKYDDVYFQVVIQDESGTETQSIAVADNLSQSNISALSSNPAPTELRGIIINGRTVFRGHIHRFSAFSVGTNVFDIPAYRIQYNGDDFLEGSRLRNNFMRGVSALSPLPINPAEHFAHRMDYYAGRMRINWHLDVLGLNYETTDARATIYPTKYHILNAMQTSDIVYIATHGFPSYGIGIQQIENSSRPIIMRGTAGPDGAEFEGTAISSAIRSHLIHPTHDFQPGSINRMKWLILSSCSQLDFPGLASNWATALLYENNVHGILGYFDGGPGFTLQNQSTERFFNNLYSGLSFVASWRNANMRTPAIETNFSNRNWAFLVNKPHDSDRLNHIPSSSTTNNVWLYRYRTLGGIAVPPILSHNSTIFESSTDDKQIDNITEYFENKAQVNPYVEFEILSNYEFNFERTDYSFTRTERFDLDEHEIVNLAIEYLNKLSPTGDIYIADIGLVTRKEIHPDGTAGSSEIVECEITAVPIINGIPVYSDNMFIHIILDNEGLVSVICNLDEDIEVHNASTSDFSEDVLQDVVLSLFEDGEVRHAYQLTETNELIPIYIVESTSYETARVFRADTGLEIALF